MSQFKEFTTEFDGDPIIVDRNHVASASIRVERRGERHEQVTTILVLVSGGVVKVQESFNDVREWLMPASIRND